MIKIDFSKMSLDDCRLWVLWYFSMIVHVCAMLPVTTLESKNEFLARIVVLGHKMLTEHGTTLNNSMKKALKIADKIKTAKNEISIYGHLQDIVILIDGVIDLTSNSFPMEFSELSMLLYKHINKEQHGSSHEKLHLDNKSSQGSPRVSAWRNCIERMANLVLTGLSKIMSGQREAGDD
jgi:hypothetical protein